MIFQEVIPNKQMALRGWSDTTPTRVIKTPTPEGVVEFCTCEFFCTYTEDVFADLNNPSDEYKNDFKSILLNPKDASSTFNIILSKGSTDYELNDNTYGVYYTQGFNTSQPLQVGYRINWLDVANELGFGEYKIKLTQTDFGEEISLESQVYNLSPYDEMRANYTTRVEWNQKGKILNGKDYTGLLWSDMVRVKGRFGNIEPQYEINKLQDSNYKDVNIQVEHFKQYTLETQLIPFSVGSLFTDDIALTDEIFISGYDVFGYDQYRQLPVTFEGTISTSEDYARNNMKVFNIVFKDKNSKLKRNFNK